MKYQYNKLIVVNEKEDQIDEETITTDEILSLPDNEQEKLRTELEDLYTYAFPKISRNDLSIYVRDYFIQGDKNFQRRVILFRNEARNLIATNICNCGVIKYTDRIMNGAYIINSVILSEYQGYGIGKIIGLKLLTELKPDVLFTTTAQSSALHSRVGLIKKGLVTGYEVYPRLEQINGKDILINLPFNELDFAISAFKQVYSNVVENDHEAVNDAIRNLTVFMVRKNLYNEMYDFDPWKKNGMEDKLAKALGARNKDGVLVMFRKKY
ncbi:MAG: hypothetical protein GY749_01870 [Desulfobacteraceae bacterium]|nr:hypothetical protein [Desulfobacteraceae bacterium]